MNKGDGFSAKPLGKSLFHCHSTLMAILELTNKIFDSFEKNEFTVGIFIDLKNAFDTVNHSILLDKLNFYGIRDTPFRDWSKSIGGGGPEQRGGGS